MATMGHGASSAASRTQVSGLIDIVVRADGRGATGRIHAIPAAPIVISFDDAALAVALLPRSALLRAAAARLARLSRVEIQRADGTWLLRLFWHGGRLRRWWSPAGLRMLPRAAVLRAATRR